MSKSKNPWVCLLKPKANANLRLICFPYAGGDLLPYKYWDKHLPAWVEIGMVSLPGRGGRFSEKPLSQMEALVEATLNGISEFLDKPYVFFGHSFGATLAYELVDALREEGKALPLKLLVSASGPPNGQTKDSEWYHQLADDDLLTKIKEFGGVPDIILQREELLRFFLPIIRADLKALETYVPKARKALEIPIAAFGGYQDAMVSEESLRGWGEYTEKIFRHYQFPGGHFYINEPGDRFFDTLAGELISNEN